ncbi:TPA: hypothetical protein BOS_11960 [Bos taurus]|nr:TPA: hypothetical protein BOS_11960 [Bos taurus]
MSLRTWYGIQQTTYTATMAPAGQTCRVVRLTSTVHTREAGSGSPPAVSSSCFCPMMTAMGRARPSEAAQTTDSRRRVLRGVSRLRARRGWHTARQRSALRLATLSTVA